MIEQPEYMYRAGGYGDKLIEKVKAIKLTAKTLIYEATDWRGEAHKQTERLHASFHAFFPSWEEARDWLLRKAENDLESARLQLQRAQGKVGNIKGLKPND